MNTSAIFILFFLGVFIYSPMLVALNKKARGVYKIIAIVMIMCLVVANVLMYMGVTDLTMSIPIKYPISLSVGIGVGILISMTRILQRK
jgi:hypothetical protein